MIRVLMLNYEYPPIGGGAANATYYMLKQFENNPNVSVDLVTSSIESFKIDKPAKNITHHFIDIGKNNRLHQQSTADLLKYAQRGYKYAKKLALENEYDLVHAYFSVPCGYMAMKLGLPYLVSLRGSDVPFHNPKFRKLDQLVLARLAKNVWQKAFKVTSLSKKLTALAKETAPNQLIQVIPNGVDNLVFYPSETKNNAVVQFVYVGRLATIKGPHILLSAFEEFCQHNEQGKLVIAGDGPLKQQLIKFCSTRGISKRVEFLGKIDHLQVAELYRKSDVFVLASLNEALGNVTQEAIASGLPIICSDTGAAEMVNGNGIVVRCNDEVDLFEAITELANNKEKRTKFGLKSVELASKMSWKSIASEHIRIYKDFLDKPS